MGVGVGGCEYAGGWIGVWASAVCPCSIYRHGLLYNRSEEDREKAPYKYMHGDFFCHMQRRQKRK